MKKIINWILDRFLVALTFYVFSQVIMLIVWAIFPNMAWYIVFIPLWFILLYVIVILSSAFIMSGDDETNKKVKNRKFK